MSFEVFRRHQKKMLATFAILAMFGFVRVGQFAKVAQSKHGRRDQPIAELYGKTVYRSGLNEMLEERTRANLFLSELNPYLGRTPFGGVKDRDLIDALILQHEADRLGMPAGPRNGQGMAFESHPRPDERAMFEACSAASTTGSAANSFWPISPTRSAWRKSVSSRRTDRHSLRRFPCLSRPERRVSAKSSRSRSRNSWQRPEPSPESSRPSTNVQGCSARSQPRDPWIQGPSPDRGRDPVDGRQRVGPRHQGQAHGIGAARPRMTAARRNFKNAPNCPLTCSRASLSSLRRSSDLSPTFAPRWPSRSPRRRPTPRSRQIREDQGRRVDPIRRSIRDAHDEIEEAKKQGTKSKVQLPLRASRNWPSARD